MCRLLPTQYQLDLIIRLFLILIAIECLQAPFPLMTPRNKIIFTPINHEKLSHYI